MHRLIKYCRNERYQMDDVRAYKRITLYGLVQGIGFRPSVVRLAQKWGIEGVVCNFGGGVRVLASAPASLAEGFSRQLQNEPPPLSEILHINVDCLDANQYQKELKALSSKSLPDHNMSIVGVMRVDDQCESQHSLISNNNKKGPGEPSPCNTGEPSPCAAFRIVESRDEGEGLVILPADLPVCDSCLSEMKNASDRRFGHPLISCTHCGPRYSIIQKAPYDRCNTAMEAFDFCPECLAEYTTPESRRFHAQTVSCHHCGPQLRLKVPEAHESGKDTGYSKGWTGEEALQKTIGLIKAGGVVAVKGIGGYHFLTSPYKDSAVKGLRELKEREQKPFAVCFPSLEAIKSYAQVSPQEEALLLSKARPIVLLEQKQPFEAEPFSSLVLQNSRYIGAFLPYTPILVRLCESLGPLVATSANLSDAPIINREEGLAFFENVMLSGILTHDREIVISQDDSVAWVVAERPQIIRRARGYTPLPLYVLPFENQMEQRVLALGGELKSTFCLQKGPFAYVSQYLGDLGSSEAFRIYKDNLVHMESLMKIEPTLVACDLHPDYATTRLAQELGLPIIKVQHHHAHIASVMAEKGLKGPVLGVSFDGTGYGSDGTIWGGEFLICEKGEFKRAAYLKPVPLLMGDDSMKDCRKTATAYLHATGLQKAINDTRYSVIRGALEHGINTILSSSMGRLFDAVSSMLGLADWNRYEAEGAILLENAAYRALKRDHGRSCPSLAFDIIEEEESLVLDSEPLVKTIMSALIKDPSGENLTEALALSFHRALCSGAVEVLTKLQARTGIQDVVLSGGVFQNRILAESTTLALENQGFKVYLPSMIPSNDGGISLGQAFIAMNKFNEIG